MENRIRELVKAKGLKMAELANRCGMTQSNLIASIRSNPKLSTLEQIAVALGVNVSDIIEPERAINEKGIVIIDGRSYVLSNPSPQTVQIPTYYDYSQLKEAIKKFLLGAIRSSADVSICGLVETMEYFSIYYDSTNERFNVSLCYGQGQVLAINYDLLEYGYGSDTWDFSDFCVAMINDIENAVPTLFGTRKEKAPEE